MNPFIKLLIGTAAGAALFLNQDAGINLAILGIILGALSLFPFHWTQIKTLTFDLILYFIALLSFAWYGDEIAFAAVWMSFFCLQIRIFHPQIHWFPAFFTVFLNCISTPIRFWFFNKWIPISNTRKNTLKTIYFIVIPVVITIAFTIIYAIANTQLADFFRQIIISENIFKSIFIAFVVFLVLFNAWFMMFPPKYEQINAFFEENSSTSSQSAHQVYFIQSAKITFILLSLLSILMIILQSRDLFEHIQPQEFSSRIHGSIAALIISLLMAIGVILIYFKNQVQDKQVLQLAYLWLGLNVALIIIASIQNTQYVQYFGLTFQRTGVFIFLLMSAFGLFLSFVKIQKQHNNAFVLNRFLRGAIITLIFCAPINFSYLITQYNLNYAQVKDIQYLKGLEYNHSLLLPELKKSTDSTAQEEIKYRTQQVKIQQEEPFLSKKIYFLILKP